MRHSALSLLAALLLVPATGLSAQSYNESGHRGGLTGPVFTPQLLARDSLPQLHLPRVRVSLGQGSSVERDQPSIGRPIGGGLLGVVAGSVAGGFIGAYWAGKESSESGNDELSVAMFVTLGFLAGVALGEPWGAACGVHIGNRRQGDPLPSIAASVAVAAAGIGAALAAEDWRILIAIPVVQIGAAVAIERSTARGGPRRSGLCGPSGDAYATPPYYARSRI
jgi:hypothetical protein